MAKRRSHKAPAKTQVRDISKITNRPRLHLRPIRRVHLIPDDRRTWRPERPRHILSSRRFPSAKYVSSDTFRQNTKKHDRALNKNLSRLMFHAPRTVQICVRRKTRREVIFATQNQGKGSRKPKWTSESRIQCRRK